MREPSVICVGQSLPLPQVFELPADDLRPNLNRGPTIIDWKLKVMQLLGMVGGPWFDDASKISPDKFLEAGISKEELREIRLDYILYQNVRHAQQGMKHHEEWKAKMVSEAVMAQFRREREASPGEFVTLLN